MSNKITVPQVKYNYALVGLALRLCPKRTQLTATERLVLIDILERLPFTSDGQVVDLGKCASWQIHRSQTASAVGVSAKTVTRSVSKLEELGLLNVIRRKNHEGKNEANSYVPVVAKLVEYAAPQNDTAQEEADAIVKALAGLSGDDEASSEVTDVPLTTATTTDTARRASTTTTTPTETKDTIEDDHSIGLDGSLCDDELSSVRSSESIEGAESGLPDYRLPECQSYGRPKKEGFSALSGDALYSRLMSR